MRHPGLFLPTVLCSVLALSLAGASAVEMGRPEAERILKARQDAAALFSVSFYFEQAGNPFSALKAVEAAIELDSKVPGYHARYGQLLSARRRLKEAGAAYGRAADMDPATKSFRAAQARACTQACLLKESAAAWKSLLDGASDKKEVLDAASNLASVQYQMNDPAGAEATWLSALGKVKDSSDLLQAAESVAQAQLAQGACERTVKMWEGLFARETNWDSRATLAERMASAANAAGAEERAALAERATQAWQELLTRAATPEQKQRAAQAVAEAHLRRDAAGKAVEVLKPLLYAGGWSGNFQTAQTLARAYAALDDAAARRALWREFLERCGTEFPLTAGKRYPVKVEMYQAGGTAVLKLFWGSASQPRQLIPAARLFTAEAAKTGDGLSGEYFTRPDLTASKLTRTDPQLNFTWDERTPPAPGLSGQAFSVRWSGWIEPQFTEKYTFYTQSDDGVRMWVDGKLAIDNWNSHGTTEDSSANFQQRYQAAGQLAGVLDDPAARCALWRAEAKLFPTQVEPFQSLAEALAAAKKYDDALDVYEEVLDVVKKQPNYQAYMEQNHGNRIIELCGLAGRPERAADFILKRFSPANNYYLVSNWLSNIQQYSGEYAALGAAERVAAAGGLRRLGAAQYLQNCGRQEAARPLFEAAAADGTLDQNQRQQALNSLLSMARTNAERIEIARRMVAVGGEFWNRSQAYSQLARYLGQEGRVAEGLDVVRQAEQLRQNNYSAGPQTLGNLASMLLQGNRVGPGLRTPQGQEQAEAAARQFYGEFSSNVHYEGNLDPLATNLAELHARRGDYDGAVDFLRNLCKVHERPMLRIAAAGLLDRKGDANAALAEYFVYLDAAGKEHAQRLRSDANTRRYAWLPGVDQRFSEYIDKNKKYEDLAAQASKVLQALAGVDREGYADVLLSFYKQRNRPEDIVELLKRLEAWGHRATVYQNEKQAAEAAIRMKNAASQADTAMRDNLLRQADQWKETFAKNPEDYAAALNVFKTYMLLGRRKDAEPYLAKAAAVSPNDPIILDLVGTQAMLDKNYAGAAQAFAKAGEITGRTEDYEGSVISAYELSGKSKDAIALALDSLAEGHHGGQGVRTVEQVLDLAERSDNLKVLYAETGKRVEAARAAKRPVREQLAQLALRLAWDNSDDKLAATAVESLLRISRSPTEHWQDEWRLQQLAQRAVERRRLEDAACIRRAILDVQINRGQAPQPSAFRDLALLLVQAGKVQDAADLVFEGLALAARAGQGGTVTDSAPPPGPRPPRPPVSIKPRVRPVPQVNTMPADVRAAWAAMILELVGQEAAGGGKEFRAACGDRLAGLLDYEMKRLEKDPTAYGDAGPGSSYGYNEMRGYYAPPPPAAPLLNVQIEQTFELRDKVTAAYQAAAAKPDAPAEAYLALARRLASLATRQSVESRDKGATLEPIRAACTAAAAKAAPRSRKTILEGCAEVYRSLVDVPEKERLAGVTPQMALDACDAAAKADEGRASLEGLRRAVSLAERYRQYDRALRSARELYKQLPESRDVRATLARILLLAGQTKEAADTLTAGLDKFSNYQEYRQAGDICMTPPPPPPVPQETAPPPAGTPPTPPPVPPVRPDAAAAAAGFYAKAIALYIEEAGPQVDAQGRPLPDRELGNLQAALSKASAAAGQLDEALNRMLASLFNLGGAPADESNLLLLAEAYVKAGKARDLAAQLEAKVQAEPKNAGLRLAQATGFEQAGDFAAAAQALRAAKALDPQLGTVKRLIADLRKANDLPAALEETNDWVSSFPRDAEAYRTLAAIYKDLKDEQGEVRALSMLVEVAPRDADNCRSVGVLFAKRKDFKRALALLDRAIELRGEEPYRHVDLAEVCFMAGDLPRAEKILKEALARDWEKGLSPELLARMPPVRGTYETRAHSLLADVYAAMKSGEGASRERLNVPAGYKRPALEDAVPAAGVRPWPWPRPMAFLRGGRGVEE